MKTKFTSIITLISYPIRRVIYDYKTAPIASKPVNPHPANITHVTPRDEANKLFAAGLKRAG